MPDISGLIKNTGVALEAEAFKQFGAAVSNTVDGLLGSVFGKSPQPGISDAQQAINANKEPGVWDPTPYASAIASGAGNYDPKNKFLFKVKFQFHVEPAQMAASLGVDVNDISRDLTFVVKSIDLPKIDFEYEEVNMYNFRTKVLKQIRNRELNMTFYDDTGNHALSFANVYMMLYKPISRMEQSPTRQHEDHGFAFNKDYRGLDTAYRGFLPGNRKDILSKMTIEQYYLDRTAQNVREATRLNTFVFINPRITNIDIADQDHEVGGTPSTITAIFDFDALRIEVGKNALTDRTAPDLGGADILVGGDEAAANITRGTPSQAGKAGNAFVDILARQVQRGVQDTVSGTLNKALGGIAGGALGPAISAVSGALGGAANRTVAAGGTSVAQGIALPSSPKVTDNSTSSSQVANLSSRTSSTDTPPGGI